MSEFNLENTSYLVDHMVQIRKLKGENNTLTNINSMYKQQISNLELEVSDLKVLVSTKDYEIKMMQTEKNKYSLFDDNLPNQNPNDSKEKNLKPKNDSEELAKFKLLLDKEKQLNKLLVNKVKELSVYIQDFEKNHDIRQCSSKILEFEKKVKILTEENDELKRKFLTPTFMELEETTRDQEKHFEQKVDNFRIETKCKYEDSVSASTPNKISLNVHKEKGSLSLLTENKSKPKNEYKKKSLTPGRVVKHFTCNLSDIIGGSANNNSVAEFCPSTMRRLRCGRSVLAVIN